VEPYTLLNLREVEDAAARHGQAGLEARFARTALALERSGISLLRLEPGFRMPFGHRHREQEEVYVVLAGSARARVGGDEVDLGPLDALRVAPDAIRAFEAGPDGVELLAFGAPSTGSRDTEMHPGWWGGPAEGPAQTA
jgi:mannose-6-phosphate isomerase-like protein (cupin superfamily)